MAAGHGADLMTIQRISDNAHEIRHRGREYTIIKRSPSLGGFYDIYIDGNRPRRFYSVPHMIAEFPHLLKDLTDLAAGGF